MCIASKCACDFDCVWQHVNAFSHCVTLLRILLSQIISDSDTKGPVLVVMECKHANVIYVYELIFLLHTSRSTECRMCGLDPTSRPLINTMWTWLNVVSILHQQYVDRYHIIMWGSFGPRTWYQIYSVNEFHCLWGGVHIGQIYFCVSVLYTFHWVRDHIA